jgi:hypothetical protein
VVRSFAGRDGSVFLVEFRGGYRLEDLRSGDRLDTPPVAGWEAVEEWSFPALLRMNVIRYERLGPGDYRLLAGRYVKPAGAAAAPIRPGAALGVVDTATTAGRTVVLNGWAASRSYAPAERVLVFAGGRPVAAGIPTLARPDVAEGRGVSAANLGFSLAVPKRALLRARGPVTVIALSGGAAAPLAFKCPPEICRGSAG